MATARNLLTTAIGLSAFVGGVPGAAQAQTTPPVRLSAPADCLQNAGCGVGLKTVYGLDVSSVFSPLASADAGVPALDDGVAEIAVVFSSSPDLSRPDVVALRDDKGMIGDNNVFPNVRATTARKYGAKLRRPLDAISRLLTTFGLRGLNQQVADGRAPEVVGAEFAETNSLTAAAKRVPGRTLSVGFVDTEESETLAHMYSAALRGAGFKVKVTPVGGLRPELYRKFKRGQFDLFPAYTRTTASFLAGKLVRGSDANVMRVLRRELRQIGATPFAVSPATDNNVFATKRSTADALGLSKLSDLERYWPKAQ